MMTNATTEATPWVAIAASELGSQANAPPMSPASAGSPTQPSPSEARVIPSCVAEM